MNNDQRYINSLRSAKKTSVCCFCQKKDFQLESQYRLKCEHSLCEECVSTLQVNNINTAYPQKYLISCPNCK